mgnify:CR=1 FL=1
MQRHGRDEVLMSWESFEKFAVEETGCARRHKVQACSVGVWGRAGQQGDS